jgi:hypothetical protein
VLKCEVASVILHENMEAGFELGDSVGWRILREKRKKSALQRIEILSDTERLGRLRTWYRTALWAHGEC